MSLVAQSLVSSSSRPLGLRRRPDIAARQNVYQGREYWVVKDPIALKYFRFEPEEYAILEMLDGSTSLEQLKRRFERRFAPQKITYSELHQLIGLLHESSLIVSDLPGQGQQLFEKHRERKRRELRQSLANILSLRFKGFDPDRLLTWLDRRAGWLFSGPAAIGSVLFGLAALLLVLSHFQQFSARLPGFHEFFAPANWFWLAVVLALTKVWHEFGHGLACKHFGGECHEMGVMVLVLTPCLYCNVTDAWMLPNKWQRAFIGAAGMYAELLLAATATFLWWFSEPGFLNYMCLNVMFVCSVSTLVFNANPLLRYDGYYILSDILEIPNLRQKATSILNRKLAKWCLGLPEHDDPFLPRRRQLVFAVYSVASAVYRTIVSISVLFFVYQVFEPYGLKVLGQLLAVASLYGIFVQPLWQLGKFLAVPGRMDQVKKFRFAMTLATVTGVFAAFMLVPLPHAVRCGIQVQPRDAAAVYVDVSGTVHALHVKPGQKVSQHQPIVTLENLDLQESLLRLEGERKLRAVKLESLRQRALSGDEAAALEIGPLEESLVGLDQQIQQRRLDLSRLVIESPAAGVVFTPVSLPKPSSDSGVLPTWSGRPLDSGNRGAFFASGVELCRVGSPDKLEAILAIDQNDIEFVKPGQRVELFLAAFPGKVFEGKIEHIAADGMKTTPLGLSSKSGGNVETRTDASGRERPVNTTYQASVSFDDPRAVTIANTTGRAKILATPQTAAARVWRLICQTFNFKI